MHGADQGRCLSERVSVLQRNDLAILFFRASCELGWAIEANQQELVAALNKGPLRRRSLFSFVVAVSKEWLDDRVEQFASLSYDQHLELIRSFIRAGDISRQSDLRVACERIARTLTCRTPAQLSTQLDELSPEAHRLVGAAISLKGGPTANARWQTRPIAPVRYVYSEKDDTRCTYRTGTPDEIWFHIGNHIKGIANEKGGLRTFFNLPFFFFHEYVSHSFSVWQLADFVEGYLIWAEKRLLLAVEATRLRVDFAHDTFWPSHSAGWAWTDRIAEWFQAKSNGRFLPFLLDWAAEAQANAPIHEAALEALGFISDSLALAGEHAAVRTIFERCTVEDTLGGILDLSRSIAGIPTPNQKPI
jgi:hypothetical protein